MISDDAARSLLAFLKRPGVDLAEIFAERSESVSVLYEERRPDKMVSGGGLGIGLRIVCGEKTYYGTASGDRLEDLADLARQMVRAVAQTQEEHRAPLPLSTRGEVSQTARDPENLLRLLELLARVDEAAWKEVPDVAQVSASLGCAEREVRIWNSEGISRHWVKHSMIFHIGVTCSADGRIQTGHEVAGWSLPLEEALRRFDPLALTRKAAKRAWRLLREAKPAPMGRMPVVIASQAGGTMIHEAIGHSLELDSVQKGISPVYAGKLGQVVAPEWITVVDDPTIPDARGSYPFDDEGTASRKNILIENGVLKGYMSDWLTSRKERRSPSGNARRESFRHRPIPRMSNTYLAPGSGDPEEILRSVEQGLLVCKMGGGQVNTASGDFLFEVEEGYEISGGRVGPMVRGAALIGNGPEVLRSIDKVGRDLGWGVGTCGKDGQGVPVSDGMPTIRIPSLTVGGTEAR